MILIIVASGNWGEELRRCTAWFFKDAFPLRVWAILSYALASCGCLASEI